MAGIFSRNKEQSLTSNASFLQDAIDLTSKRIQEGSVASLVDNVTSIRRPSGVAAIAMGHFVRNAISKQMAAENIDYSTRQLVKIVEDYQGSGTTLIQIGGERKRLPLTVGIAHMDEIGSSVAGKVDGEENTYRLKPVHADRLNEGVTLPAEIWRYNQKQRLEQVGEGIVTKGKSLILKSDFPYDSMDYTRVVYNPVPESSTRTRRDGDRIAGVMDNSAGVAAALAAVVPLAELARKDKNLRKSGIAILLTDTEEGPPTDEAFSRGAERFVNLFYRDRRDRGEVTYVDLDGGDFDRGKAIPKEPFYATVVSDGKGPVMGAKMQSHLREFTDWVGQHNGQTTVFDTTLNAKVSRSNPTGLMHAGVPQEQIITMDYGVIEPHHSDGQPAEVSLENVTNAAKIFAITLAADTKGLLGDVSQKRRRK